MPKIPPHSGKESIEAFKKDGYELIRVSGDHFALWKDGLFRPLIVPLQKELPQAVVMSNLRTAGMTKGRYLELLTGRPAAAAPKQKRQKKKKPTK